jgi:uncharacterized protein (DUF488 family)
MQKSQIWTIGHSISDIDAFVEQLKLFDIDILVDIRSYPSSRRYPHFNKDNLCKTLASNEIGYKHILSLGGRRNKQSGIDPLTNAGWKVAAFKNYADYTNVSVDFEKGLCELMELSQQQKVAYMCSEALPWRCHRLLVSNVLVMSRKFDVNHIIGSKSELHKIGKWGAVPMCVDGRITYP